jgi:hypothetical protein
MEFEGSRRASDASGQKERAVPVSARPQIYLPEMYQQISGGNVRVAIMRSGVLSHSDDEDLHPWMEVFPIPAQ